jgi:septum formation protein
MRPVILASTSDMRKQLLLRLLPQVSVMAPDCDETPRAHEHPRDLALRLAIDKAASLKTQLPDHLIIGSDQVATLDDQLIIGKPMTQAGAIAQLQAASNRIQTFYTSLCLLNTHTGTMQTDVVVTQVHFRMLSDDLILRYVTQEDVRYCAGSFKAESAGIQLFSRIDSPDPTALLGLPLIRLVDFFIEEGVALG